MPSNGAALAVITPVAPDAPLPDLFCMALLAPFGGYFPGYSREIDRAPQLPDLGDPEGAYRQPRRRGDAALGRPARYRR